MIRILCADISQISEIQYAALYRAASPERQQRADRCRCFADSLRCIFSEVLLRTALNRTFGHWDGFPLTAGDFGKPRLADRGDFHFSVSHSGHWVVLAYGGTELGIDVQQICPEKARPAVARRFFTAEEQAYLQNQENFTNAYYQIWTGKESFLKYRGTGLAGDLASFSVLSPGDGLHYFWETLDGHSLCLCTLERDYRLEILDINNAPA